MRPTSEIAILIVAERTARWGDWLEAASRQARHVEALVQGPREDSASFMTRVSASLGDGAASGEFPRVVLFVTGGPWHGGALGARVALLRRVVAALNGLGAGRLVLACDAPGDRAQKFGLRSVAAALTEHGAARGVTVHVSEDVRRSFAIDEAA